jgi:hypothetical protein
MHHLVTITHTPQTCPAAHAPVRTEALPGLARLLDGDPARPVTLVDGWASMPGHFFTLVVDAPDAHAVHDAFAAWGFGGWSTVSIEPMVTLRSLRGRLEEMA